MAQPQEFWCDAKLCLETDDAVHEKVMISNGVLVNLDTRLAEQMLSCQTKVRGAFALLTNPQYNLRGHSE